MQTHKERQVVVFELGEQSFALDIHLVREIMVMQKITRVPNTGEHVEGIINLRGKVIPVISLLERLGMTRHQEDQERIVVVDLGGFEVGLTVDTVSEVLRLGADVVEPPSDLLDGAEAAYLEGVAKLEERLILLLDLEKVITRTEEMGEMAVD